MMINSNQSIQQHITRKYHIDKKIGSGAYGHVWKVFHKKTKQVFALKKIFDAFQHSTDAQRTYREIMFLREFNHPNIIKLHKIYRAQNDRDIYLLFQYMEADLHHIIRQNILQQIHQQFIIYQIAIAIRYLHSGGVIHRDLKPSNILLNSQCYLKICDFGLVRSVANIDTHSPVLTEFVATRWYRAPEILMGSNDYTKQVDLWSFGCIIAEMLINKPLFPGNSTLHQLQLILNFTGIPTVEDISSLKSDVAKSMIDSISKIECKPIKQWFPMVSAEAIDLIQNLLQFNPKKRYSCDQVLNHPYIRHFAGKCNQQLSKKIFKIKNDQQKFSMKEYRNLIYEILKQDNQNTSINYISKNAIIKKDTSKKNLEVDNHQKYQKPEYNSQKIKPEKKITYILQSPIQKNKEIKDNFEGTTKSKLLNSSNKNLLQKNNIEYSITAQKQKKMRVQLGNSGKIQKFDGLNPFSRINSAQTIKKNLKQLDDKVENISNKKQENILLAKSISHTFLKKYNDQIYSKK